ncbi:hypothetical protein WA158_007837 [Blastocystis sp. Blastoise]
MVKEKLRIDADKIGDIQNDVIHFERLISDLIGILSKSMSFCIHSGDSINGLLKHYLNSNEKVNMNNDNNSKVIIQEPSYVQNECSEIRDDNGIDYIRFRGDGPLYSLPKRVTNTLVGSYLYEQAQKDQRTVDGNIYLDYPYDDSCAPLLIDALMNKKIDVNQLKLGDQIDLLRMFEFCELSLPEELVQSRNKRDYDMKKYEEGDEINLIINGKKDVIISDYFTKNDLWKQLVNIYGSGYINYDKRENQLYLKINCLFMKYMYEYIYTGSLCIPYQEIMKINKLTVENEMYNLFGNKGVDAVNYGWDIYRTFQHSFIITKEYDDILANWLGKEKKWKLLFRASEHDYLASEFHKYCDNKGETVILIKHIGHNNHINIFGGYTNQNWYPNSGSCPHYGFNEFLFTLSNEHGIPPTKYDIIRDNYRSSRGIYCSYSYGPCFGSSGNDIHISDQCHNNSNSYCYADSYQEINTAQKNSLFVNTNNANTQNIFTVEDYEVWGRDNN